MPTFDVDFSFRDFVRVTPQHPAPIGDPTSGVHNPTKRDFRELGHAALDAIAEAEAAADLAVEAMLDVQGASFYASNLTALLANPAASYPAGTVFATRAEGFSYSVVSADPDLVTAGGVGLRPLPEDGLFNVRAFGAKGDGVTDDTAAFQAAANRVGDGVVVIPPGTYMIHEVLCAKGTCWKADNGSAEVSANANGAGASPVVLRYNGTGGAQSFMLRWQAATYGQYIYGGGIVGRPNLSGQDLCATLIDCRSTARQVFDLSARRATFAGMSLNSANGALSSMCSVRMFFAYGATAAVEGAHGIVMNGEVDNKGCTQHDIQISGLIRHGDMARMIGNCDNNRLNLHGAGGGAQSGATGHVFAGYDGAVTHPRNNKISYLAGLVFQSAGCFGNVLEWTSSEGQVYTGELPHIRHLTDYLTGRAYSTPTFPLHKRVTFSAAEMVADGATVAPLPAGIGAGFSLAKDATERGAILSYVGRDITKGRLTSLRVAYTGTTGGDIVFRAKVAVVAPNTGFVEDLSVIILAPAPATANAYKTVDLALSPVLPVQEGAMIAIKITRLPADTRDTNTGAAVLLGAGFEFASDGPLNTVAGNPAMPEFLYA